MTVILLLSTCLLLILLCSVLNNTGLRSAILQGYVLFGSILALSTELISMNRLISYPSFLILWGSLTCILLFTLIYRIKKNTQYLHLLTSRIHSYSARKCSRVYPLLLAYLPVTLIILITGFMAIYAPANTWDSLAYRLTRVEYWIQYKSLDFYATHDQRQLYVPPFLEMFMLHLRVLSGDDRLANIPQWLALVASVIGVTSITKQLGGNRRQQLLSAYVVSTIPMGVYQAPSTQSDFLTGAWLVCFILFFIHYLLSKQRMWFWFMALSLGLACLTKPTGFLLGLPFVLWLILHEIRQLSWKTLQNGVIFTTLFGCIVGGHYLRNYQFYGSPFGHGNDPTYSIERPTPTKVLSNFVKNLTMHFAVPSPEVNNTLRALVISLHEHLLHLDVNHPDVSWPDAYYLDHFWSESSAGNPVHMLIILICMFLAIRERNPLVKATTLSTTLALILLFSLLKWQIWVTRLHLPALVIFSPIVGYYLGKMSRKALIPIILILLIQTVPPIFYNYNKPLLGQGKIFELSRDQMMFVYKPWLFPSFEKLVDFLEQQKFASIGIFYYGDEWEYPIIRAMRLRNIPYSSKHVSLWHEAAQLEDHTFNPQAVIFLRSIHQKPDAKFLVYQKRFTNVQHFNHYVVYYNETAK